MLRVVQNPDVESDWFIPPPFGPGWARESVSLWLNKLGNLCLVTLPQNSANSNASFGVKKELMFKKNETTGTQKGSIALSLASHGDPWSPVAVKKQHIKHLNLLAKRWGIEDWTGDTHRHVACKADKLLWLTCLLLLTLLQALA